MEQLDFDGLRPQSSRLQSHHDEWRSHLRSFVDEEIQPHIDAWGDAGTFPDEVYVKAAKAGLMGMGFPASVGGWTDDTDLYHRILFAEEMHKLGSGVVFADLATHWIGLPPVAKFGGDELIDSVVRPVLSGARKICFAVTEPDGGSDVSRLATSGKSEGDSYIVSGTKTLISGATRSDWMLTVVRTSDDGAAGLTLLLIDSDSAGVSMEPVAGLSWYSASNATIHFDNVRVPQNRRIGEEGQAFRCLTEQFNTERFSGVAATLAMARVATADAIAWARERYTFKKRLIDHQSVRHKLVDMVRDIRAAYCYLDYCVESFESGAGQVADLCMLKVHATRLLEKVSRDALHILGGEAYREQRRIERIHRESRIFSLGGGTEEVLNDLAARQMRF